MITKTKSSQPGFVRVCFELPACVWADRVYLVGDFNGWDRRQTPLQQDRHGIWRTELDLPYGNCFEFRYLVDNRWLTDCHSDGVKTNIYGTQNSIVETVLSVAPFHAERQESQPAMPWMERRPSFTMLD